MQAAVIQFFDENEAWLERVLERGRAEGILGFGEPAREAARLVVSALQGAMLTSRPYGEISRFQTAADVLLSSLVRPAAVAQSARGATA